MNPSFLPLAMYKIEESTGHTSIAWTINQEEGKQKPTWLFFCRTFLAFSAHEMTRSFLISFNSTSINSLSCNIYLRHFLKEVFV